MVKTMTIDEAAKYLRENGVKISKETLSDGIQGEKLPFGVCIETGRSRVFMIFKRLVDKWLEERAEIGLDGVIKAGAQFMFEKYEKSAEGHTSGVRGNAAAFGWMGNAAASGASGTATVTGRDGGAKALGNDCLAAAWGPGSKAMGKPGNWLVLSEHKPGAIVDARLVRVDGEIIKLDTWYTLRRGEIVEVAE